VPYHAGAMNSTAPLAQNVARPGVIELGFGEPDARLLPVDLVREAAEGALEAHGPACLAYGQLLGPPVLRAAVAARIAALEHTPASAEDVVVTGGNAQALDLVLTRFASPGDVVLVESPTYNLALKTIRDHPVDVAAVPLDAGGLDMDALEATLEALARDGRRVALLYTIPTHHNPSGVCLEAARRRRLVELARRRGLLVVEDDVYRELTYDGETPPSLWSLDREAPVVRLGSFSKTLAPGLRVGWIDARPDLLERFAAAGVLDSGGGISHFAACLTAQILAAGHYDGHVARLRAGYAARRDALAAALRRHLPAGCTFVAPAGGFFIWVTLPPGADSGRLLPAAEAHGVSFAPGAAFCSDGDARGLRLAFSFYDERTLAEGARRLGAALATPGETAR
jgi:2-aminoadipate transaminase